MILLDPRDHRPIYEQITDKLSELILLGVLPPDSPLPSVRNLASELSINPNTVQRAYQELERRNITYTVPGVGRFVSPEGAKILKGETNKAETLLREAVERLKHSDVTEEQLVEMVRRIFRSTDGGEET